MQQRSFDDEAVPGPPGLPGFTEPDPRGGRESDQREGFPKWGFALIAVLALMVGANAYMVWLSSHGRHDLVRSDYYDAGLDQDNVMARNGLAHGPGMEIAFVRDSSWWRVEAGAASLRKASCSIHLYRPDDEKEDRTVDLGVPRSASGAQAKNLWQGPAPKLRKGYWVALLQWREGGKPIMEESFRIYVDG